MEMKKLLIQNNFCFLEKIHQSYDLLSFSPKVYSVAQKDFFQQRYKNLKTIYPRLSWEPIKTSCINTDFLAWDAFDEKKESNNKVLPFQNRLMTSIPFTIPEGFSSFRKKIEQILPSQFNETIPPTDPDVLNRLHYFFDQKKLASTYFETRNGVVGNNYSTQLSAFLSCGSLDVRYLYNYVKDYEKNHGENKSTYWIIFELLWREFFYWHYQKHESLYFSENGLKGEKNFSSPKEYSLTELRQLLSPELFRAALTELEQTGFMSNRIRQIFASIWINDLQLPWRSGALLFEKYLIDYDVYSNYGNWMYLSGVGVDPRGKRYFNVEKQLSMYDPSGEYIRKWQPL